ncbi:HU family DNA-binding protein [Frigidibacter oleivorans]|uniref:HU family DNA-binding protein n=1 Tax=Frigidibacter oleivorans TaxID=2487129 RepID=UPI000F8E0EBC|nr:HU family DNA-binding protein [Frigidibacter oleivorans]
MTKTPTPRSPAASRSRSTAAKADPAADAPAKKTPARKPKAAAAPAVTPADTLVDAPAPEAAEPAPAGPVLRKKDLIDRVVAASGAKKKVAKDVVEATLQVLGDALAAGDQLVLPPFGHAHRTKTKDTAAGGATLTVKLRRGGAKKPAGTAAESGAETAAEGLAEPAE